MEKNYFVHESSYVDDGVTIGDGTKIWHFCHIQSGASIGANCSLGQNVNVGNNVKVGSGVRIQNNVSLYEGVELENNVFCGPSCVFTNVTVPRAHFPVHGVYAKTLIREGASLGANCTVVCGHTVGRGALIAAGAVVTHDVPDFALMAGVPARRIGWVCECGKKLNDAAAAEDRDGAISPEATDGAISPGATDGAISPGAGQILRCSCGRNYRLDENGLLSKTEKI